MNRYQTSIQRVTFGIAAIAMTTITIGAAVIMPAKMGSDSREPPMLAASKIAAPASMGAVTGAASIDVVTVREPGLSTAPCTLPDPNRKPEG